MMGLYMSRSCPHCQRRHFDSALVWRTTSRGRVLKCLECGGEYKLLRTGLTLVWPKPSVTHEQ